MIFLFIEGSNVRQRSKDMTLAAGKTPGKRKRTIETNNRSQTEVETDAKLRINRFINILMNIHCFKHIKQTKMREEACNCVLGGNRGFQGKVVSGTYVL